MRKNPERLAWIILLAAFFACIGLTVALPLGSRTYVLNAREEQDITLQVQRGPLRVTMAGRGEPIAIARDRDDIPERTIVATDYTAGRLVMRSPHEDRPVVASLQLYDNTEVVLSSARSPRFPISRLPHEVDLTVNGGRVRITVSALEDREAVAQVETPYGTLDLGEGSYEIKVGAVTAEVTVLYGQADVHTTGPVTRLRSEERVILSENPVAGPLAARPNLVVNGGFQSLLDENWISYNEQEEAPEGTVEITTNEGREVAYFQRSGQGHAETGISQMIDADISEYNYLQLHLMLRITAHDVPMCGTAGSECPVMVRLVYEDANEADQEWLQGFYWRPDTSTPGNPQVCVTCSTRNPHIRVEEDTWYPYLSANLIPLLSQDGQGPRRVKSITIYASGHSYQSMVTEVELVGQQ